MAPFKMKASPKCKICKKSVYAMDPQLNLDGNLFHKPCAKCQDCRCQISLSNFTKNESGDETILLCKIHYFKRFHEEGSYLGSEKFQKSSTSPTAFSLSASASMEEKEKTTAAAIPATITEKVEAVSLADAAESTTSSAEAAVEGKKAGGEEKSKAVDEIEAPVEEEEKKEAATPEVVADDGAPTDEEEEEAEA